MAKKRLRPKKLRPLGDILLDMEPLLFEMGVDHDLQHGEILALVLNHCRVHMPDGREEYVDGGHPDSHYGPCTCKNCTRRSK